MNRWTGWNLTSLMVRNNYLDDALLPLSGIQHFAFCERQWALIHVEQVWQENLLTVEGRHVHERVDDPFCDESRGDLRIVRSVPVLSRSLGLQGVADLVEFHKVKTSSPNSVQLPGVVGSWVPRPVEFKRGKPKPDSRDEVQLCAQAISIEEMMNTHITHGDLYYWQTRRKQVVELTDSLRNRTKELAARMHACFITGATPAAIYSKSCSNCSLKEPCQPKLARKRHSVSAYIKSVLDQEESK